MEQNGACYIRVSTDDQTEYSPDAQLKAILKYAKANQILITKQHIYVDEGISGRKAEKRPAFMKMIATAKSRPKPFDIILVHKFDRFARSREDSVVYKSLLKKEAGIKVVSITESIEDDKFSIILEAMLEAMAEYYSINLSEEVTKGMTEKAERGGLQATPSFGYTVKDNILVPLEGEAELVKMAFEKYGNHEIHKRQLTLYFNDIGARTHRGNKYEMRTIDYMLRNPVYIGKLRWTPNKKTSKINGTTSETIITEGGHEPLIDMEAWEKVQERLSVEDKIYKKRQKHYAEKKSWLCGLLRCSACNSVLVIAAKYYFRCNSYAKGKCRVSNNINFKLAEELILEKLRETFTEKLEITITPKTNADNNEIEYELLSEQLSRLDDKEIRIKEAYHDGIDTLEEYKENKKSIARERSRIIASLKSLRENVINNSKENGIYTEIKTVYEILQDENIDMQVKYKSAHLLIDEIIYNKAENTLKMRFNGHST